MKPTKKTGAYEYAETTINIARGCSNDCRYCYAKQMLVDRFKIIRPEDWRNPVVVQKRIKTGLYTGTIMMPSSHDIVPEILPAFMDVLEKLLEAGNEVLLVTKPQWQCVTEICDRFLCYKEQILWRFTIGSTIEDVLTFWEPYAPSFDERMDCLEYAHKAGFRTSVSCEPYLDGHPENVYMACEEYVTESFWIGFMRHFGSIKFDNVDKPVMEKYVYPVRDIYRSEPFVRKLYDLLKNRPMIKWKESVRELLGLKE